MTFFGKTPSLRDQFGKRCAAVALLSLVCALACTGPIDGSESGSSKASLSPEAKSVVRYELRNFDDPFLIVRQAIASGTQACIISSDGGTVDVDSVAINPQQITFNRCGTVEGFTDGVASQLNDGNDYDFDFDIETEDSNRDHARTMIGAGEFTFDGEIVILDYQAVFLDDDLTFDVDVSIRTIFEPFVANGTIEVSGTGGTATCTLVDFKITIREVSESAIAEACKFD